MHSCWASKFIILKPLFVGSYGAKAPFCILKFSVENIVEEALSSPNHRYIELTNNVMEHRKDDKSRQMPPTYPHESRVCSVKLMPHTVKITLYLYESRDYICKSRPVYLDFGLDLA